MIDLAAFNADDLELRLRGHLDHQGDGCWTISGLWHDKDAYPILCVGRHRLRCNRVAYHLWIGPIPTGLHVLHTCDNSSCIQPAHLYAGTVGDNARDRERRHRRTVVAQRRAEQRGQLTLFAS